MKAQIYQGDSLNILIFVSNNNQYVDYHVLTITYSLSLLNCITEPIVYKFEVLK